MKKIFKATRLAAIMAMLFSFIVLTSCSDDNKDNPSSPIIGTWRGIGSYNGGTEYYTFNTNGTYSWECRGGFSPNSHNGYYTFNNDLLITTWIGPDNYGEISSLYLAQFPDNNTLMLTNESGNSYTYKRE